MVIYADVLLVLNWWIDFLLLSGVRRLAGVPARPWRLALGGLSGAAACFVLFLPAMSVWLSMLMKLAAAAGMVRVAFRWQGWRPFVRQVLWLFSLSAALAGVCGALYFFVAPEDFYVFNGVVYYAVPPLLLVGLTVVCYGFLWLWEKWMRRRAPAGRRFMVRLFHEGRSVHFLCLYDSGNHLTEPFSGRPVLVVERSVAQQLVQVPTCTAELPAAVGNVWRLVPFDSLGGAGLLPAFTADRVVAETAAGEKELICYIAVCDRLGRGEYQGLLGSALGEQLT